MQLEYEKHEQTVFGNSSVRYVAANTVFTANWVMEVSRLSFRDGKNINWGIPMVTYAMFNSENAKCTETKGCNKTKRLTFSFIKPIVFNISL